MKGIHKKMEGPIFLDQTILGKNPTDFFFLHKEGGIPLK
jgi:hypothetical protein